MRVLVVAASLLLIGLAGCTAPDQGDDDADRYFGTCPAWTTGQRAGGVTSVFDPRSNRTTQTDRIGESVATERNGHPLDRFVLAFDNATVIDGRLEARAFRGDDHSQLPLRDFRQPAGRDVVPVLAIESGDHGAFDVFVDLVPASDEPAPTSVRIEWSFARNADGDLATDSFAAFRYGVAPWYRVCGLP